MSSGNDYRISCDRTLLDIPLIHEYLTASYWSPGIPLDVVERAIEHSLCFGAYCGSRQVGFARVITDQATFAYLADVFILEPHRGQGLSKQLMIAIDAHPALQGLRRFMLATRDAHGLYAQFGFTPLADPSRIMERFCPDVYAASLAPRPAGPSTPP
jgi:GNAT superfamily N-acetyltransferase